MPSLQKQNTSYNYPKARREVNVSLVSYENGCAYPSRIRPVDSGGGGTYDN